MKKLFTLKIKLEKLLSTNFLYILQKICKQSKSSNQKMIN